MKVRKNIYIEDDLLKQINEDNISNFSKYISTLIERDISNQEITKLNKEKEEKNLKYLINNLQTQNQIQLNLLIQLITNNKAMIPYHKSDRYREAKKLVDSEKAKNKDKMKGVSHE